jgi:DNA-binding GntR family transcriptional regulator
MPKKMTARTSKNQIYTTLRSEIILGHRKPGERLAVDDLKTRFGTSVTPVRDALQMLNQEGLITIKPRSGYFITQITLKALRDMLELREILEKWPPWSGPRKPSPTPNWWPQKGSRRLHRG